LETGAVRALLPLADGSVLIATTEGMLRWAGGKFSAWPPDNSRLYTALF
jgi:hypothetical protein